jgi:hypothetical protein
LNEGVSEDVQSHWIATRAILAGQS